jgi:hypothetical protein
MLLNVGAFKVTNMLIIGIAIYIVIAFLLTVFEVKNPEEWVKFIFLSIILTPIYSLIVSSKKKNTSRIDYYQCKECGYIFPMKLTHCPLCEENGVKVKLIKYENPYNLKSLYQNLSLT